MMSTAVPPQPGRPRDPQKDRDVLQAARDLLVEEGFAATTIVAVARRAGVGAPTIYRRWPGREALIEDAAFGQLEPTAIPPHSGDLRADLRALVKVFHATLANPVTRVAVPGLLASYQSDFDLYQRLLNRTERDVRAMVTELVSSYLHDLPSAQRKARSNEVFDFMVATTAIRALLLGNADAETFYDTTADSLTALAYSTWRRKARPRKSRRAG